MSAVPAEVVDAKTGVEEPLVVHVLIMPASGPQNNVLLLPKELDEKVAKMHFTALDAELIVMSGEVGLRGTSPKADCGATVLYDVVLRLVFTEFLVQLTRGSSVRELWTLSELRRQVHMFSEGFAHSPAAQQGCMFSLQNLSWVDLVRRRSLSSDQEFCVPCVCRQGTTVTRQYA